MAEISVFEPRECGRIRKLLDHFLSGELSVETNQDILSHLEQCTSCREEERSRAGARSRLGEAWDDQPVPEELRRRVLGAVGGAGRPRLRVAGLFLAAAGAAGLFWIISPPGTGNLLMAVDHYREVAADHLECSGHPVPPRYRPPLPPVGGRLVELMANPDHPYRLMGVRVCRRGEVALVHYAFQGPKSLLSLMLEDRAEGEEFLLRGDEPQRVLHGLRVSLIRQGSTTLAVFQTDSHRIYLAAGEAEETMFELADRIIPALREALSV